jgi:hypothetical protein
MPAWGRIGLGDAQLAFIGHRRRAVECSGDEEGRDIVDDGART